MKKKERKRHVEALAEYGRYVSRHLDLGLWEFIYDLETPDDPNAFAQVNTTEGRRVARVFFAKDLHTEKPETIHHTIIHELVHCVLHEMCDYVRLVVPKVSRGQRAYDALWEGFRIQNEYTTDHLAYCFGRLIPINEELMRRIRGDND